MINLSQVIQSPLLNEPFTIYRTLGHFARGGWVPEADRPLATAVLHSGGVNYHVGDVIQPAEGVGATLTVLTVDATTKAVKTFSISAARGYGYDVEEDLPTTGGHGTGFTIDTTAGPANPLPIPASGIVTVATDKDLTMVPEGDRVSGMMAFYTTSELHLTSAAGANVSDQILWRGDYYRLMALSPWVSFGFYKAIGVTVKGS